MIGILPLIPAFVQTNLGAGAFEFGLLSATASLGYVLASVLAVRLERQITPFRILTWGSGLAGLMLIPFLTIRWFPLLLLLRFLSALFYGAGNLVANVQIVKLAPSEIRGRVDGASWALIKVSQVASSATLAGAAKVIGVPPVIALASLGLAGCAIALSRGSTRRVLNNLTEPDS